MAWDLTTEDGVVWDLPATGAMRVPGRLFAVRELLDLSDLGDALRQVRNVAHLPGIVEASMAMPDIHPGYGFPIGGVAATDVARGGVISPGGVGFDICCGVRLLVSGFELADVRSNLESIMGELDRRIPRGSGPGSIASGDLLPAILREGAVAAIEAGYGQAADLERTESGGTMSGSDPRAVSIRARDRGRAQIGSLGSGNHFLELQAVEEVLDQSVAGVFGIRRGSVCVMIHCGSRGLGHQICQDAIEDMTDVAARYGVDVPDRQLASVPVDSQEARSYLAAMAAAANFAWANRQILTHATREALAAAVGVPVTETDLRTVYDVAHNLARLETHEVRGERRQLCVHRKGATTALGPGHAELPADLRAVGQPVLIPGSMGTASWILKGLTDNPAFASAAHGAGRVMSRSVARATQPGHEVLTDLEARNIAVRPGSVRLLAEEAPFAYKDVDLVVESCRLAGLAAPVARLRPLGVVKG